MLAYCVFIVSDNFTGLAIGQVLLAGFFSFKTGSDNALLYDSLKNLGRTQEYASREANGARWGLISMALAALLGGVGGTFNLALPYALALLGSIATIITALQFSEPATDRQVATFFRQLRLCFSRLKEPVLLWLMVFYVLSFSLTHIPAEFNQPYIKLLDLNWLADTDSSAIISGMMVAISMLGGVVGATISIPLLNRYGVNALLVVSLICILIIIAGMASVLHPLILTFVLFRNFPMALSDAPLLAAISPHIESSYRATYLSLQSLAGRLGFSLVLLSLSNLVGNNEFHSTNAGELSWTTIQHALTVSAVVGLIGLVVLTVLRQKNTNDSVGN